MNEFALNLRCVENKSVLAEAPMERKFIKSILMPEPQLSSIHSAQTIPSADRSGGRDTFTEGRDRDTCHRAAQTVMTLDD